MKCEGKLPPGRNKIVLLGGSFFVCRDIILGSPSGGAGSEAD